LAARKKAAAEAENTTGDVISRQLAELLSKDDSSEEAVAYEALQLAQSAVRKRVSTGQFGPATDLGYESALTILKKGRVSVASQLLTLLVEVLRETHTIETTIWVDRLCELHAAHDSAMENLRAKATSAVVAAAAGSASSAASTDEPTMVEVIRLHRLQKNWLRRCINWSSELGTMHYGQQRLHELLGEQCWMLANIVEEEMMTSTSSSSSSAAAQSNESNNNINDDDDDEAIREGKEDVMDSRCDAVVHMSLAEKPNTIVEWLRPLSGPTAEETRTGHSCPPALRDALLTRSALCFVAMQNLRDANGLVRSYANDVEERDIKGLQKSYVSKDDGKAPSHVVFCSSLLRVCEKDLRTGPLFSWLLRSFKKELDLLYKPNVINSYTVKTGKIYFNIQPPPNMMNMMENMMSMMGGGGGMGGGGSNPAAMMQAMAQMQQGM